MEQHKADCKRLVTELSDNVKRFAASEISADEAWRVLQTLTARLQELLATPAIKADAELVAYLNKANVFREKAALQIVAKRSPPPPVADNGPGPLGAPPPKPSRAGRSPRLERHSADPSASSPAAVPVSPLSSSARVPSVPRDPPRSPRPTAAPAAVDEAPQAPPRLNAAEHRQLLVKAEESLNTLLALVTKQPADESMRQLQDITRQLQDIDGRRTDDCDAELLETAKRLNFFREEIAVSIVAARSAERQAEPPPVPSRKSGRDRSRSPPPRSSAPSAPAAAAPAAPSAPARAAANLKQVTKALVAPFAKTDKGEAEVGAELVTTEFTTEAYDPGE